MAFIFGDKVKETSLSVGTGPMTLGGATAGFQSFASGVGLGNECFYGILNTIDNSWEMGRGTVGVGTITRDTVFSSSNANNLVNFAVGDKLVYTTVPNQFYSNALDVASHSLVDHTVGPLNLLDATAHSAVDHTAAPFNLLSAAAHAVVDHTAAPFNLLNATAHQAVDHTAAPLNLLDTTAHGLVDHSLGPLFLLDTTAHNVLNHDTLINAWRNTFLPQVSAPEKTAGTEPSLRSFSPLDIANMAGFHGGGGGSPMQVRLDTLTWSAETGPKSTTAYAFTPLYAITITALHTSRAGVTTRGSTMSIGLITGTGASAKGVAESGIHGSSDEDHNVGYDEDAVAMATYNPDLVGAQGFSTNFSGPTGSWELDVTAFVAGGITIAPSGGSDNITGKMFLLVVGS